jgi:uncharacterized damage-inducible protein DinB
MKTTISINLQTIKQVIQLLETMTLGMYRQPLKSLHNHSVGQHTRHIIEFYGCLWSGIKSKTVNYDLRERNTEIETNKDLSVSYLKTIVEQYSTLETDELLSLQTIVAEQPIQSTLQRELIYLVEHTTHHLAIIKIGLNEAYPTFEFSKNLGVAASTINYRNQAVAA